MCAMNAYRANLLDRPSLVGMWCPVCSRRATDGHHVVPKGMGGVTRDFERRIPIVRLCHGCHMDVHAKLLHIQWDGRWLWFRSARPMGDEEAWERHKAHYSPMRVEREGRTFGRRA